MHLKMRAFLATVLLQMGQDLKLGLGGDLGLGGEGWVWGGREDEGEGEDDGRQLGQAQVGLERYCLVPRSPEQVIWTQWS